MADLDQQLADLLADGRITIEDAEAVRDFRRFLAARVTMNPTTDDEKRLYKAWLPYLLGRGDPPPDCATTTHIGPPCGPLCIFTEAATDA